MLIERHTMELLAQQPVASEKRLLDRPSRSVPNAGAWVYWLTTSAWLPGTSTRLQPFPTSYRDLSLDG